MSIETEITRLNNAKQTIKTSIENKGVEVPQDTHLDGYAVLIDNIQTSSSGGLALKEYTGYDGNSSLSISSWITDFPEIDLDAIENAQYLFYNFSSLTKPKIKNTESLKNISGMFQGCTSLTEVPNIVSNNITDISYAFMNCSSLTSIPNINLSNCQRFNSAFSGCSSIENATINVENATALYNMFYNCANLKTATIQNSNKVTDCSRIFEQCVSLANVSEINAENATSATDIFFGCNELMNFGGLIDYGKNFKNVPYMFENNYSLTLDFSACTKLTHTSLMNIINGLYDLNLAFDVENGGSLYRQMLVLGETNLAKLTEDEIAMATNKGWNVS